MTSIQNTIVNRLPVVTKVGQLLVSVDEFIEGDGLVAVVGDGAVPGHSEGYFERHSKHFDLLPVCTVHQNISQTLSKCTTFNIPVLAIFISYFNSPVLSLNLYTCLFKILILLTGTNNRSSS